MWTCIKYILLSKSALNSILFWSHLYKCIWNCGTWDTHKCYTFIWRPSKYSIKRVMCVCKSEKQTRSLLLWFMQHGRRTKKVQSHPLLPFAITTLSATLLFLVYYSSSTPPAHILFPKSANWSGMVQPWVLPDILYLHWFLFKLKYLISL